MQRARPIAIITALLILGVSGAQSSNSVLRANARVDQTQARASIGILLLAHGGQPEWNGHVEAIATAAGATGPVEVAFGMASRPAIQGAVDRLEARKVTEIVAVPLFISSHSSVVTSTAYLLGLRSDMPADLKIFAKMNHGHGGGHGAATPAADAHAGHAAAPAETVDGTVPVKHTVPIRMGSALDAHPIVADILTDRAAELSQNPANEVVILVAHGPVKAEEDAKWVENMQRLAARMTKVRAFARIETLTVRDDAPAEIKAQATAHLRATVEKATAEGKRALIVPLLLSYGGIEKGIRRRLEGLDYAMSSQALLPDARLATWVQEQAARASN